MGGMTEAAETATAEPYTVRPLATTSTVQIAEPLQLAPAVGPTFEVRPLELHLSWTGRRADGIKVTIEGERINDRFEVFPFRAESRPVEYLEATNPGITAALREAVPYAPWA